MTAKKIYIYIHFRIFIFWNRKNTQYQHNNKLQDVLWKHAQLKIDYVISKSSGQEIMCVFTRSPPIHKTYTISSRKQFTSHKIFLQFTILRAERWKQVYRQVYTESGPWTQILKHILAMRQTIPEKFTKRNINLLWERNWQCCVMFTPSSVPNILKYTYSTVPAIRSDVRETLKNLQYFQLIWKH